jgi:hypothetical protein
MRHGGRQRLPGERGREDGNDLVPPLAGRKGMAWPSALERQGGFLRGLLNRHVATHYICGRRGFAARGWIMSLTGTAYSCVWDGPIAPWIRARWQENTGLTVQRNLALQGTFVLAIAA